MNYKNGEKIILQKINLKKQINMMVIGKIIKKMVKVKFILKMEINQKVNLMKIKQEKK